MSAFGPKQTFRTRRLRSVNESTAPFVHLEIAGNSGSAVAISRAPAGVGWLTEVKAADQPICEDPGYRPVTAISGTEQ